MLICIIAIAAAAAAEPADPVCTRIEMGPSFLVGRINFVGHTRINDSTLRRAMTLHEGELFTAGKLLRSLERINEIGLAEAITIATVIVSRNADGASADITIPIRERRRRWWLLSGPLIPGLGSYHAEISARLPPWGRGILDASTYYLTFNVLGLMRPLLAILPLVSTAPPAVIALERPLLPGQEWLSGFAVSPQLSARSTIAHYGRTQLSRLVRVSLDDTMMESLAVPITGSSPASGELLVCTPPKPRLWWLRRGVLLATDVVLAFAY